MGSGLQVNVVEHTRLLPKFIDNEDAAIISAIVSNSSQNNSLISKKLAGQSYSVVHNGTAFVFSYYDDLSKI